MSYRDAALRLCVAGLLTLTGCEAAQDASPVVHPPSEDLAAQGVAAFASVQSYTFTGRLREFSDLANGTPGPTRDWVIHLTGSAQAPDRMRWRAESEVDGRRAPFGMDETVVVGDAFYYRGSSTRRTSDSSLPLPGTISSLLAEVNAGGTVSGPEDVGGVACWRVAVHFSKATMDRVFAGRQSVAGGAQFDVWFSTNDASLRRLRLVSQWESPQPNLGPLHADIELQLDGHNAPVSIEVPSAHQ